MPYTVKYETTKPTGIQWYGQSNRFSNFRLKNWIAQQPGLISGVTRVTAPNVLTTIAVYESEAAYNAIKAALETHPRAIARRAYAEANGFVTTTTVLSAS